MSDISHIVDISKLCADETDGVWVTADGGYPWDGVRALIRPAFVKVLERVKRRQAGVSGSDYKRSKVLLDELLLDIEGIAKDGVMLGIAEAREYLANVLQFVGWVQEEALRLASEAVTAEETSLGN